MDVSKLPSWTPFWFVPMVEVTQNSGWNFIGNMDLNSVQIYAYERGGERLQFTTVNDLKCLVITFLPDALFMYNHEKNTYSIPGRLPASMEDFFKVVNTFILE